MGTSTNSSAPTWWTEIGLPAEDFERFTHELDDARHEAMRRLALFEGYGS